MEKKVFTISLQQFGTNKRTQAHVSNKTKIADIDQMIDPKKKYQFSFNSMLLSATDSLECFGICNGDFLTYKQDLSNYDWRSAVIVHFYFYTAICCMVAIDCTKIIFTDLYNYFT